MWLVGRWWCGCRVSRGERVSARWADVDLLRVTGTGTQHRRSKLGEKAMWIEGAGVDAILVWAGGGCPEVGRKSGRLPGGHNPSLNMPASLWACSVGIYGAPGLVFK